MFRDIIVEDLLYVGKSHTSAWIYKDDILLPAKKLLALLQVATMLVASGKTKKDIVNMLEPITPRIAKLIEKTRKDEIQQVLEEIIAKVEQIINSAEDIARQLEQQAEQNDKVEYFEPLFSYTKWSEYYKTTYSVVCGLEITVTKTTIYSPTRKNSKKCRAEDEYVLTARLACRKQQ